MIKLKNILENILKEKRRNPEQNPKISMVDALEKYKDDPSYFITFTHIEKVGVNPKSPFSTPVGLYAYNLKDVYDDLYDKNYLFGSDRPFVNVIKSKAKKMFDLEKYSDKDTDVAKIKNIYEKDFNKSFDDLLDEYEKNKDDVLYPVTSDGKYVYGLMNYISNKKATGAGVGAKKSMIYFNTLLRRIGYDGVFDRTGTVHLLQPSQAVFLVPSSYSTVERIINKNYGTDVGMVTKSNYRFIGPNPTVDNVILRTKNDEYEILLIKRGPGVEAGKWALPGGFIDTNAEKGDKWKPGRETPMQASVRELQEETGLYIAEISSLIRPIGVYEGNNRDPRDNKTSWSKSHAFGLVLPDNFADKKIKGMDDAVEAKWFSVKSLPRLAFDHGKIIQDGLKELID